METEKIANPIHIEYPELGKKYKHYKGGLYEVITMAQHSETKEPMVVYKSLLFGSVYTRPLSMWFDIVETDEFDKLDYSPYTKHEVTRFRRING